MHGHRSQTVVENGKYKMIYGSIKGASRNKNKDDMLLITDNCFDIFFVYDGVSSAAGAIEGINIFKEYIINNYTKYIDKEGYKLESLIVDANNYLLGANLQEPYTTCSCVYLDKENREFSKIASVGDSRVYGISNQYIYQYTEDDNLYLSSNVLTKCIGWLDLKVEDIKVQNISASEKRLLLCTDGFYKILEANRSRFHKVLNMKKLESIKKKFEQEIFNKNSDDATYLLVEI